MRFREEIAEPYPEWENLTREAVDALRDRGQQEEEGLGLDVGVTVVGELFEINSKRSSIQLDARFGRPFVFVAKNENFQLVDALRWQKVEAKGKERR